MNLDIRLVNQLRQMAVERGSEREFVSIFVRN
jgi:hypothetical protein